MYFDSISQKGIFSACGILIIGLMALDFVNPSLPYIMRDFSASQAATKGLMVIYLATAGIAQLFHGAYADRHGRRRAIFLSFMVAIAGFLISALSQSLIWLYLGRFVTALGTAGAPVVARAIISGVCHDQAGLKKAFSWFAMSSQLSPALAPVAGGIMQQWFGWHAAFFALIFVNAITTILLFYIMPETYTRTITQQKYRGQIAVYAKMLKLRQFMLFSLISALVFVFTMGFYSLSPFVFHILGYSAIENGLFYILYASGLFLGSLSLTKVFKHYAAEVLFKWVLVSYPAGFIFFITAFYFEQDALLIILFSFTTGMMCGVAAPLALVLCMEGFSDNKGIASALQGFIKIFFAGIALLVFNFVELHSFVELAMIFLILSLATLLLYKAANESLT